MTTVSVTDEEFRRAAGAALQRDLRRANRVCAAVALTGTLMVALLTAVALA